MFKIKNPVRLSGKQPIYKGGSYISVALKYYTSHCHWANTYEPHISLAIGFRVCLRTLYK